MLIDFYFFIHGFRIHKLKYLLPMQMKSHIMYEMIDLLINLVLNVVE